MAEAAGLALAILPLIVSAIEHYKDCLGPGKRFYQYASQARKFLRKYEAQHAIFLNQCRLLLEDAVEPEMVDQMLHDNGHPSWKDPKIDEGLQKRLEASYGSCTTVIEDINTALTSLREWSLKLCNAIEQEAKVSDTLTQALDCNDSTDQA